MRHHSVRNWTYKIRFESIYFRFLQASMCNYAAGCLFIRDFLWVNTIVTNFLRENCTGKDTHWIMDPSFLNCAHFTRLWFPNYNLVLLFDIIVPSAYYIWWKFPVRNQNFLWVIPTLPRLKRHPAMQCVQQYVKGRLLWQLIILYFATLPFWVIFYFVILYCFQFVFIYFAFCHNFYFLM